MPEKLFYIKYKNKKTTIKFLFFSFTYVKGSAYKDYVFILDILKSSNIDVTNLYEIFKRRIKKKFIKNKTYKKDMSKLQNILDNVDLTKLKPINNHLRNVQLQELEFAKEILEDIYKNTDIKPFMDFGTLLGAVRHKGFIPWDDDIDFSLMRPEFDKLCEYLKKRYLYIDISNWGYRHSIFEKNIVKLFEQHPNEIFCVKRVTSFKVFKGTKEKYAFVDFFSLDYFNNIHNVETLNKLKRKYKRYRRTISTISEMLDYIEKERAHSNDIVKDSDTISYGVDNLGFYRDTVKNIIRKSDIYPLQKMQFEDTEFWAPANPNSILKNEFNFYNKLPVEAIQVENHKYIENRK